MLGEMVATDSKTLILGSALITNGFLPHTEQFWGRGTE